MKLDLNLLVPLNALLQERSVVAAARRIGLSQPACSAALARLRTHFDDQLLIREPGHGVRLTLLGERLREPVAELAADVDRVFLARELVEPSTLNREFSVLISDAESVRLAPQLIRLLGESAPLARVSLNMPTNVMRAQMVEEIRRHDLAILPNHAIPRTIPSVNLYSERWVCVIDTDSPLSAPLSIAAIADLRWVVCYDQPPLLRSPSQVLDEAGLRPDVAVRTEGFLQQFPIVAGSALIALMPQHLAETWCAGSGTRWLDPPPELGAWFTIALAWHPVHTPDPAHRWLRELTTAAAAAGTPGPR